ncbi:hypothetical protein [Rhodoferax sp.]|nr:hypothetical protein [Rhodoferax sp.]
MTTSLELTLGEVLGGAPAIKRMTQVVTEQAAAADAWLWLMRF